MPVLSEPGHEKTCLMSYTTNKGANHPTHPHSLISAFVVLCLDSKIFLDSIAEISLASVAAQAGLCLAWSETPKDTFSHDVAQFCFSETSRIELPHNKTNKMNVPPTKTQISQSDQSLRCALNG